MISYGDLRDLLGYWYKGRSLVHFSVLRSVLIVQFFDIESLETCVILTLVPCRSLKYC